MITQPTDGSSPTNLAAQAIARDSRRVRVLTGATVVLWFAAVVGIGYLLGVYYFLVIPRLNVMTQAGERIARQEDQGEMPNPEDVKKLRGWTTSLGMAVTMGAAILAATVGVLALATLGTMLLVFAARRATLRQIQVSLADISTQLAEIRGRTPATVSPPG